MMACGRVALLFTSAVAVLAVALALWRAPPPLRPYSPSPLQAPAVPPVPRVGNGRRGWVPYAGVDDTKQRADLVQQQLMLFDALQPLLPPPQAVDRLAADGRIDDVERARLELVQTLRDAEPAASAEELADSPAAYAAALSEVLARVSALHTQAVGVSVGTLSVAALPSALLTPLPHHFKSIVSDDDGDDGAGASAATGAMPVPASASAIHPLVMASFDWVQRRHLSLVETMGGMYREVMRIQQSVRALPPTLPAAQRATVRGLLAKANAQVAQLQFMLRQHVGAPSMLRLQNALALAQDRRITTAAASAAATAVPELSLVWCAPFFSGGGYSSEAQLFALPLAAVASGATAQVRGAAAKDVAPSLALRFSIVNFGDGFDPTVMHSAMPPTALRTLLTLGLQPHNLTRSVVVCHSEPGAWQPPASVESPLCPTARAAYRVGRTMVETDRLPPPALWAERFNAMDELWVPTHFHRKLFCESPHRHTHDDAGDPATAYRFGAQCERVRVVPEAVDTAAFDPSRVQPVYPWPHLSECTGNGCDRFVFLSVFKWEERKGWRFLIEAFVREFMTAANVTARTDTGAGSGTADDAAGGGVLRRPPILYILTSHYHDARHVSVHTAPANVTAGDGEAAPSAPVPEADDESTPIPDRIARYTASLGLPANAELPSIVVLRRGMLADRDMPQLYRSADAFVLPTRGEGWCRPCVEAMSMALPVIVTEWSGPTAFLTPDNSLPLRLDALEPVALPPAASSPSSAHVWAGSQWARPSVAHLRQLMRTVANNSAAANDALGGRARRDMLRRFTPQIVTDAVMRELQRIEVLLRSAP